MKKMLKSIGLLFVLLVLFYAGGLLSNRNLIDSVQKEVAFFVNYLRNLKK